MQSRWTGAVAIGLAFAFLSLPTFGKGEWESPEQEEEYERSLVSDTNESPIEMAQAVTTEPVAEEGPVEPPRTDTFPVVRADEANAPRPRNPQRLLEAVDTADLAKKLAADRLLLSEIRKDVPESIEEARLYLERLKELAVISDPVRLAQLFDRVLDQAPIYFEWLETEFEDQDEQITEYYVGGARGFAFAMDNFKSAVFFVIMNRLDVASRVISELEK
jgi:hypothetical protein